MMAIITFPEEKMIKASLKVTYSPYSQQRSSIGIPKLDWKTFKAKQ
jgi:hypothetical protein